MNSTCKKLRSRSGASMVIALLFMLICVFVGGSVLVAATVNGSRVADDRETQQSILDQRSACSVMFRALSKSTKNTDGTETLEMDVSLKYDSDGSPNNTYDISSDTLKYVICESAKQALVYKEEKETDFTLTDTDGNPVYCYAKCNPNNYTVYIRFKDGPGKVGDGNSEDISQVQLRLLGRDGGSSIVWYSGKILKAGQ